MLAWLDWQSGSSRDPPVSTFHCWDHRHVPPGQVFSVGAGDRNSGPHARIANTSPIELSVSLAHCLKILDVGIPDITLSAVQMGTELLIPVQS